MVKDQITESDCDYFLRNLLEEKMSASEWRQKQINDQYVQPILNISSKKKTGNRGEPDFIYKNENSKLLVLIENKANTNQHKSVNGDDPIRYAVDGARHYLSFFKEDRIKNFDRSIQDYFRNWKFIGVAVSGNVDSEYENKISTFAIVDGEIHDINIGEILTERQYLGHFENNDYDIISIQISQSSVEINNLLRNLDSQKRPVLLSALMICLFPDNDNQDFKNQYGSWTIKNIIRNIPTTIEDILSGQEIPDAKIKILRNELAFIKTDYDLNNTDTVRQTLDILNNRVIPLFEMESSFDIIGRFYEEFLRYAGVANVKNGIVLTPNHIRALFTELIDIKQNDVFLDPACGTGGLLISPMVKLQKDINASTLANKQEKIQKIKESQLIGFEKNTTMFSLSISNMLFRGDGKSNIHNEDFFSKKADEVIDGLEKKPTIGFVNPPYGGKDTSKNPTKKEVQFLERMLDKVSRYGVIIAPLSCFIQDNDRRDNRRDRILRKHTLKYVINMPVDLFQPNAATATAIAVFETHKPHGDQNVVFYNLTDDGFVLHKVTGRSDRRNAWPDIKDELLDSIFSHGDAEKNKTMVKPISDNEEWLYQSHCKTDYSLLSNRHFENSIKEYSIFLTKCHRNILDNSLSELEMLDLFRSSLISEKSIDDAYINFDYMNCGEFPLLQEDSMPTGLFRVKGAENRRKKEEIFPGEYFYITTSNKNNGVSSTSRVYENRGGGHNC